MTSRVHPKWLQKAKEELGEDDKEREGAVETLRTWVDQQTWLKSPTAEITPYEIVQRHVQHHWSYRGGHCAPIHVFLGRCTGRRDVTNDVESGVKPDSTTAPTKHVPDHNFLLRFLRVRKFSQLGARETLTNYWTGRTKNPKWFSPKIHPGNPAILELIKTGFFVYMPGADSQGRKVIIERPGYISIHDAQKKHGDDIIMQTILCILDVLNMDERIQINGFVWLHDASHTSRDTSRVYNMSSFRKGIPYFQKGYPSRIKSLNSYNMPMLFDALLVFVRSLLMEKIAKRLHIHGKSMVSVYREVEQSSLPREYLPDDYTGSCAGTLQDAIGKSMVSVYRDVEQSSLPREYLPDDYTGSCAGTLQDAIDNMVKDFTNPEVINHVTRLNSGKYLVDRNLKKDTDVPAESFRKLHVE